MVGNDSTGVLERMPPTWAPRVRNGLAAAMPMSILKQHSCFLPFLAARTVQRTAATAGILFEELWHNNETR
jgi:hypothetical protein